MERTSLDSVSLADRAAFGRPGEQGTDLANGLLSRSHVRVQERRARGRGSMLNPSGRFEAFSRTELDDGWQTVDDLPAFKTEVQIERARTIITKNTSPKIRQVREHKTATKNLYPCPFCMDSAAP